MKTIYKTTLSIFLFSVLMVFGAKTAMGADSTNPILHCFEHAGSFLCFKTLYMGNVLQLKNTSAYNIPLEIDTYEVSGLVGIGVVVTPRKGFQVSSTSHSIYDEETGAISLVLRQEMTEAPTIDWNGDNKSYDIDYDYKIRNPQAGTPPSMAATIAQAEPLSCPGGSYQNKPSCYIKDSYKENYEVYECPFQNGFICPGYDLPTFSGEPIEKPEVLLDRIIPPVGVTVKGKNTKTGEEKTGSMEVPSAEDGQPNVQIFWISQNATSCKCTKSTGEGCGIGVSSGIGVHALATGEDGQGNYALTETTTFKVTCD